MFWVIKTCFQNYYIQVENKLLKHYLEIFKEQLFFIFVKNIETKTPPNAEVDKFIYVIIMMVSYQWVVIIWCHNNGDNNLMSE